MALNSMVSGSRMASNSTAAASVNDGDRENLLENEQLQENAGNNATSYPFIRTRHSAASATGSRPVPEYVDRSLSSNSDDSMRPVFASISNWLSRLNPSHAINVVLLCFINLINYMDRSTVAGMINSIKKDPHFHVHQDKYLGLLQTAFVVCYMIFAPIFGYLGDRYNRKIIMGIGLTFWSLSTFIGSFMTNFWWFLVFRAFVGIGEASYSTIAPAIISDIFTKDTRSQILALFYFAIPVGTGLGYIVGSEVAAQASDWRWGLRVTPFLGLIAIVGILFFMIDPPRGESEGASLRNTSPKEDMKSLARNKSYVCSCIAFTCVTFSAGSLMWWGPEFAYLGAKAECGAKAGCETITQADISYKFGIVMTFAGLLGVPGGSYVSQQIRHKVPNADPLVSGFSLILSVPVLFFGFLSARYNINWCYGLTFLAGLLLNCNWAIVSDMTLYIVIPTRRSIASATQILVSHALGDAISPYLIGVISDWIRPVISPAGNKLAIPNMNRALEFMDPRSDETTPEDFDTEFRSLQYALFSSCFFQIFGAFFFLMTSFYVLDDKRAADEAISGQRREISDIETDTNRQQGNQVADIDGIVSE